MKSQGATLIEVLVALVILTSAGVSSAAYVSSIADSQLRLLAREEELARAERLLTALSLLSREDLDMRLGLRDMDEFVTIVSRPEPELYRLAVARSADPQRESLTTVVHRPGGGAP